MRPVVNDRVVWSVCLSVTLVSPAKTAEPIEMPFGLWTRVDQWKHKFIRIHQVAPVCPQWRAHWRHLANTIEPSVCDSHAALCQITLTTCYNTNNTLWCVFCEIYSLPSRRQHLSDDDCLEDKREDYQNCFMLYCVLQ